MAFNENHGTGHLRIVGKWHDVFFVSWIEFEVVTKGVLIVGGVDFLQGILITDVFEVNVRASYFSWEKIFYNTCNKKNQKTWLKMPTTEILHKSRCQTWHKDMERRHKMLTFL